MILRPPSAAFTLVAPNGWGKSAIGLSVLGDHSSVFRRSIPDECRYWLKCIRPETLSLIPQKGDRRFSALSVVSYLAQSLVLGGSPAHESRVQASDLLAGLWRPISPDQPIWTLSGGEEQLLFLIGQLVQTDPAARDRHLSIWDDPFSMLDEKRSGYLEALMQGEFISCKPSHFLLLLPRLVTPGLLTSSHLVIKPRKITDNCVLSALASELRPRHINTLQSVEWTNALIRVPRKRIIHIPDGTWTQTKVNLVLGPNGSGKSLFASLMLAGSGRSSTNAKYVHTPQLCGSLVLDGRLVENRKHNEQLQLGVVPQHISRVAATVDEYIKRYSSGSGVWKRVELAVDELTGSQISFGFIKLRYTCRYALSLFQQGCNAILFDEPDTGLDESSIAVLVVLMAALVSQGALVVSITHSPDLYPPDCNRTTFQDQ